MSIDEAARARRERNQALVELMLLAASADGQVSAEELEAIVTRAVARPEFEGTSAEELNGLIEQSAARLSEQRSLDAILASVRERLRAHRTRLLGFGLAASVAFYDQRATRDELGLLKAIQAGLGISESEVAAVITAIETGESLPTMAERLGAEPLPKLLIETMVLVTVADGTLPEAEAEALVETLAGDPTFAAVTSRQAMQYVAESVELIRRNGLSNMLELLAQGLATHGQRKQAYRLAAQVAAAQTGNPRTRHMLELLQATFGLDSGEVARLQG